MDELRQFGEIQGELDLYISFLRKREELENEYAESLRKLYTKQLESESKLDEETEPTGWRIAWLELRTNVKEDAVVHKLLAQKIHRTVGSLVAFRESRDRIRRRIQDDVKSILSEYSDYKTIVLKLKRGYEKRIDDAQSFEDQEAEREREAVAALNSGGDVALPKRNRSGSTSSNRFFDVSGPSPAELAPPGNSPTASPLTVSPGGPAASLAPPAGAQASLPPGAQSYAASAAPTVTVATPATAPPVFISGATATSLYSGRTQFWDPPMAKTSVFDTLSRRDKMNSLVRAVGQLTQGREAHVGSYSAKSNKIRSRLRRDAEQADIDYRDGVFRLETLRLQRIHVQQSAARSLAEFCADVAAKLQNVFQQHVRDVAQSALSLVAVCDKALPVIARINPARDAHECSKRLPEFPAYEPPLHYVNRFVGECRSLLIGVSLMDYHAKTDRLVPRLIETCIARLEEVALDVEGIYRVPGKLSTIQQIVHRCEKDEEAFAFAPTEDAASIAGVLKLYLRQLPAPLFNFPAADRIVWSRAYRDDADGQFARLIRRIRRLAPPHQATLKLLCEHLSRVAQHHAVNKMPPYNLGLMFTPVVFGENDLDASAATGTDMVMEFLILNHKVLFENTLMDPQIRQISLGQGASGVPGMVGMTGPGLPGPGMATMLAADAHGLPPGAQSLASAHPSSSGLYHSQSMSSLGVSHASQRRPSAGSTTSSSSAESREMAREITPAQLFVQQIASANAENAREQGTYLAQPSNSLSNSASSGGNTHAGSSGGNTHPGSSSGGYGPPPGSSGGHTAHVTSSGNSPVGDTSGAFAPPGAMGAVGAPPALLGTPTPALRGNAPRMSSMTSPQPTPSSAFLTTPDSALQRPALASSTSHPVVVSTRQVPYLANPQPSPLSKSAVHTPNYEYELGVDYMSAKESRAERIANLAPLHPQSLVSPMVHEPNEPTRETTRESARDMTGIGSVTRTSELSHRLSLAALRDTRPLSIPYGSLGISSTDSLASASNIVNRPERRSSMTPAPRAASGSSSPSLSNPSPNSPKAQQFLPSIHELQYGSNETPTTATQPTDD